MIERRLKRLPLAQAGLQQTINLRIGFSRTQLRQDKSVGLLFGQRRIDIPNPRRQQRIDPLPASAGVVPHQPFVDPNRRLERRMLVSTCLQALCQLGTMGDGMVDDCRAQLTALSHMGNTQRLARRVGQGVHDRRVKIVAISRNAIELLAALIKRLVSRSFLDHVFARDGSLTANAIDQRPLDVTVAHFQAHAVGPARQLFQGVQCEPSAVRRRHTLQMQPGKGSIDAPLSCIPAALFKHAQGNPPRRLPPRQFLGIGIEQHPVGSGLTQPRASTPQHRHRSLDRLGVPRASLKRRQQLSQPGRRRQVIEMHLAQGIVTGTAGIGDGEQLFVSQGLGRMAHAPQQGQAIPLQGTLQRMVPGTVAVVLENRPPGLGIGRMLDAPFFQR
ncbi:hypothetical protein D3C72_649750 [compost metagenome]